MSYPWYDIPDREDPPEDPEPIRECELCGAIIDGDDDFVTVGFYNFCPEHVTRFYVPLFKCDWCGCEIKSDEAYYRIGDRIACYECADLHTMNRYQFDRGQRHERRN